jgi:light-regulated signal transduction histidine kinase (bacteriophytochrome)
MKYVPPFGQADLSNCEREPIQRPGAVQPHGVLLLVDEGGAAGGGRIERASANAAALCGRSAPELVGQPLGVLLAAETAATLAQLQRGADLSTPVPWQGTLADGRPVDGLVHRRQGRLLLELEALDGADVRLADLPPPRLAASLAAAVQRIGATPSIGTLGDALVQIVRDLTGYDRVMVYRFDPDGHGHVMSEARDARLAPLLGHHYPASDIPAQARALYLANRFRMLPDVDAVPAPLWPAPAGGAEELDLSLCQLRAMSPMHLQYLRNMGVTASCSVSLVRDGQLWGLIAAHHHMPRRLRFALRKALELLAEVASTRIAAIENYAHAQVGLMVRRLEQRLIEATSHEGDWRYAIFRNPRTLLQPLEASGVVLFHEGELLTAGEVPSTPELRALLDWVRAQPREHPREGDAPVACSALAKVAPALAALAPTASGVLAVPLAATRPDWLIWLRKEQLLTVTWAGDPTKPMQGDDPLELSPRRSFDAWSEIVRGTAAPWSGAELALARAIGAALVDIIVQVQAVRLLIAEHQLAQVRASVAGSRQPVLVLDAAGRLLFANEALAALRGAAPTAGCDAASLFVQQEVVAAAIAELRQAPQPWLRELELRAEPPLPVALRAEVVGGRDGQALGLVLVLSDLRERHRADAARRQLEASLRQAAAGPQREADDVVAAILTNASLAAMDIADARGGPPLAPVLEEVDAATRRAAAIYRQIRALSDRAP